MKKALKRSLSLLLAITLVFGSAYVGLSEINFDSVFAVKADAAFSGTCGNNLTWTLDGSTLTISGRGKMDDYSDINSSPFYSFRSNVHYLVIDYGVTTIGAYSFNDFVNITSIRIPNTVTSIGDYAFRNCTSIQDIIYLYMDTVTYSLTSIGECAFVGCDSLTWTSLPGSIKSVGEGAFACCDNLASIDVDPGNTNYISVNGVLFNINKTEIISYPAGKSGSSYYIPDNVTSINDSAFAGCSNLYSIIIPNGVTTIGDYAFSYCGNIDDFTIPNTVTSIGDYSFEYCNKITSITIPDSVTSIGRGAFEHCISLETVTIPSSVTTMGYSVFYKSSYVAINGYRGSLAEDYANEYNIEFIPITCTDNDLVHISSDWIIDENATCTKKGAKHKECTVCGERIETAVIAATGHTEVNIDGVAATCTTNGKTGGKYCSACNTVIIAQTTIPANGHTASVWIVDSDSTCTLSGSRHKECTICGEILETATISPTGHTEVKDAAIPATCTTAGKTEGSHCSACDVVIKAQTVVPATGVHTTSGWIIDTYTTCTSDGSKYKECISCGKILETVTYPATGHTTGHWIVDLQPTASTAGSQHKECIDCGKVVETETIPQLKPATPKVATTNEIGGVQVTWNKVAGATKYVVYRRQGGYNTWVNVGTTTGNTLLDKNVKSGIFYVYSVRAYNNAGQYSDFVSANTQTRKFMATPKLTTIYNHVNGLAIKWNAVAGITEGYRVYRRGAGSTYWTYLGTTKNLYFIDNAVKNKSGEYFRYTVIADGDYHSKFDTTGLYLKRLANPTLTSAVSSKSGVTVKWGAVKGTTGYYVYRKTANSTWTRVGTVGGTNNTTFLDKTAKKGTTYTYTVKAVYGATTSSYNAGISCYDKY